jgi:hypothetical protein
MEAFTKAINAQTAAFVSAQAMSVQRDQGQIIDLNQMPQDRMLVPMNWIVCIDVSVFPLGGEISKPDEEGVERLANGEEPVKQ